MSASLLGYRDAAIEWWRVRKVNYDGVLWRILRREATKKRGAHVDASREEFRRVTRQRWERLMGSVEQGGHPQC